LEQLVHDAAALAADSNEDTRKTIKYVAQEARAQADWLSDTDVGLPARGAPIAAANGRKHNVDARVGNCKVG